MGCVIGPNRFETWDSARFLIATSVHRRLDRQIRTVHELDGNGVNLPLQDNGRDRPTIEQACPGRSFPRRKAGWVSKRQDSAACKVVGGGLGLLVGAQVFQRGDHA